LFHNFDPGHFFIDGMTWVKVKIKNFEFMGSTFWLILGIIICVESYRFNLGHFNNPGPGFLPFGAGLILGSLSLIVMTLSLCKKTIEIESFWEERSRWPKVALTMTIILFYGLLLETLGFLLTTFIIMGFLFRVFEPQKWSTVFLGAILSSVGSYIIFQVWLEVELPKGFLGI
jgi:putative tricarboxylic transport membrane protein